MSESLYVRVSDIVGVDDTVTVVQTMLLSCKSLETLTRKVATGGANVSDLDVSPAHFHGSFVNLVAATQVLDRKLSR
jgi:hypothetical protein